MTSSSLLMRRIIPANQLCLLTETGLQSRCFYLRQPEEFLGVSGSLGDDLVG